jgi:hypothetical protein
VERRYGRYTVVGTLGSGGMGDVYRARDERLGRDVALKTVRNVAGLAADTFRSRFDAEARALASLSHPAIVHVHDLGIEGDEPYLVMELVDGPSLKAKIAAGPMTEAEVRAMGIQLARGLEAAHQRGILHRDIKPANILLAPDGQWKLADFGIARIPDSDLTLAGQFLGTPAYAAPEALAAGDFSEQSDVFSLAVTMVEAATGVRLRGSATVTELVKGADALVLPPELPPGLAAALRPALARAPSQRPDAARFAELLAAASRPPPRRGRTLALAGAVAGVLGLGLLAVIAGSGDPPARPASPEGAPDAAIAASPPDAMPERVMPPVVPGRITVRYPPDLAPDSYAAYAKVADQVRVGNLRAALERLDEYEAAHGATPESRHLRAQIEAMP